MNKVVKGALGITALALLAGCNPSMKPLGFEAQKPYVPMSLMVVPRSSMRIDVNDRDRLETVVRNSGAFSFVDRGFPRKGYCLVISEPPGKGAGALTTLGVLTLLTLPIPYSYVNNLDGKVYKDGQLLRTFTYKREGMSAVAWYIPPPQTENRRQMLTELMTDVEASGLIPHVGEQGQGEGGSQ